MCCIPLKFYIFVYKNKSCLLCFLTHSSLTSGAHVITVLSVKLPTDWHRSDPHDSSNPLMHKFSLITQLFYSALLIADRTSHTGVTGNVNYACLHGSLPLISGAIRPSLCSLLQERLAHCSFQGIILECWVKCSTLLLKLQKEEQLTIN